ncbi:hypothetical protein L195_g031432 [Trifolium pratense]|uniref:Uncharacterized protein n=1 Tax=Trifolium pratense TaxID=57577 RepID=A0A2K3LAD3_TRIPR|nr:hypothetical protein L195_g031432 [Trifolium pratense]
MDKSFYKILNEHSSEKIIYLGFLKGSVKDSDGFAKKNLRGVYEIEGKNIVGVGYGNGNFKTTFLPMYLKVYDHEQGLEKYTRAAIIIHYMMQPCLDRYDVSIVAYGQNHSEKTHIMVDVANELDFLLALARNDDIFCRCFRSLRLPKGKEVGFAFGIICIHAFIQWDPGELNFPIATTTWVGIDRDLDEEVSLDFDPKPEVWTGEYTQGSMERE